jgi:prepilin-type N-terminal cleavage/methylation domain-containing protein
VNINNKAFTLIELLVVVLIAGILAAVALPQYQVAVLKSRFATVMQNVKVLKEAQERYYLTNGEYTLDFDKLDIRMPGCDIIYNRLLCSQTNTLYRIGIDSNGNIELVGGYDLSYDNNWGRITYRIFLDNSVHKGTGCRATKPDVDKIAVKVCGSFGKKVGSHDWVF